MSDDQCECSVCVAYRDLISDIIWSVNGTDGESGLKAAIAAHPELAI